MTSVKTINLLASQPAGPLNLRLQAPSIITTALLAAMIWGGSICLRPAAIIEEAHADTPAAAVPEQTLCRVSARDASAYALCKADGWVPWDALLNDLPATLAECARLDEIQFDGDRSILRLTGTTWDVNQLPQVMLFFSKFAWLKDPVPVKIQQDLKSGTATFVLQVEVVPDLSLEAPP